MTRRSGRPNSLELLLATTAKELIRRYGVVADRRVSFTVGEVAPARYAFQRAVAESSNRNALGHLMFLRLVAEIGIRFAWAADFAKGDSDGARRAIDALAKRDLKNLAEANRAIGLAGSSAEKLRATIAGKEAPRQSRQLAEASPLAGQSYAMYRFASALVHPGFGMRDLLKTAPDMEIGLRDAMVTCIVLGAEILELLAPDVEGPDVESVLADEVLAYSPTALGLRLRRALGRAIGLASAPMVDDVAMTIATTGEGGWEQTLEATLRRRGRTWTIKGTAPDPADAYATLEIDVLASAGTGR